MGAIAPYHTYEALDQPVIFPAINKHTTDLPKMFIVKTFSTCQQNNLFEVVHALDL